MGGVCCSSSKSLQGDAKPAQGDVTQKRMQEEEKKVQEDDRLVQLANRIGLTDKGFPTKSKPPTQLPPQKKVSHQVFAGSTPQTETSTMCYTISEDFTLLGTFETDLPKGRPDKVRKVSEVYGEVLLALMINRQESEGSLTKDFVKSSFDDAAKFFTSKTAYAVPASTVAVIEKEHIYFAFKNARYRALIVAGVGRELKIKVCSGAPGASFVTQYRRTDDDKILVICPHSFSDPLGMELKKDMLAEINAVDVIERAVEAKPIQLDEDANDVIIALDIGK